MVIYLHQNKYWLHLLIYNGILIELIHYKSKFQFYFGHMLQYSGRPVGGSIDHSEGEWVQVWVSN